MTPYDDPTTDVVDLDRARRARQPQPIDAAGGEVSLDKADDLDAQEGPDPVEGVVVFHPEPGTRLKRSERPRRAVIPGWMRDREAAKAAVSWAVGYYAHCAAFHTVRLPVYWLRLSGRSPVGLFRIARATARWVFDADGQQVHRNLGALTGHDRQDATAYLRLQQHRQGVVRGRSIAVLSGLATMATTGMVVVDSPAEAGVAAAIILPLLGCAGRRDDRPITGRAVDTAEVPRLTVDLILTALGALGMGEMNKALRVGGTTAVGFPAPITRDGPGWRADIDLPPGVTAGDVIERRDKLASGLRRQLGCVWPEVDQDAHEGRLILWVGDKPLSGAKPVAWPLAKAGKTNVFAASPIGVDQRGRSVTSVLMFASGVIGAIPRMGKTFLLRLICLAAALDPRVELHVYNLKGGSDLDPLEAVAHRYRVGDEPEDIDYLARDLRALREDMRRRYRSLRELPKDICPESKVTDDLANRRSLGLHPILVAADECQVMFEHPSHGRELEELVTDLVKRGPAVGIMVWLATQRPDAKSIPTGISANAVLRLCLKVQSHVENDMVLGSGAYKSGVRATMFSRKDLGIALLAGEGEDPVLVRAAYVDTPAAETIAARARATRHAAGLLTGHAAGLDDEPDQHEASVLDHLATVWPADTNNPTAGPVAKVWCDDLADLLAAHHPGTYDGWTGEQVTSAVRPHGLRTVQIKRTIDGRPVNKRGLAHTDLTAALEAGSGPHGPLELPGPSKLSHPDPDRDNSGSSSGPPRYR